MTPEPFGDDYWRAVDAAAKLAELQLRILREVAARKRNRSADVPAKGPPDHV